MHIKKVDIAFILLVTFALLLFIHTYLFLSTPPDGKRAVKTILIPRGASFRIIAKDLEGAGIITSAERFSFLARLKGSWKKVQAGEYEFHTSMTPLEVLDKLLKGHVKEYTVIIPEGYNLKEIGDLLDRSGIVKREDFLKRAMDRTLALSLRIDSGTLEGFLFPDTYRFTKDMMADEIIKRMVNRFNEVYRDFEERARALGMSKREVVTLASIVEKETGVPEERAMIAAVFHNRLKRGMRLESDPTVIYGLKDFNGNLTRKDLETLTPYNTYKIYALPPTPIANPGKAALEATLHPAPGDYLYFVSRNDGQHHFSKDLKEHNRMVMIYQKARGDIKTGNR